MLLKKFKYLIIIKLWLLVLSITIFWYLFFFTNQNKNNSFYEKKIIFILDVSHSMNTQDIKTTYWLYIPRLEASKQLIAKTIQQTPNNKFWMIIFSKKSNYFIPPTYDTGTLLNYLSWLNTNIVPAWWSNIAEALKNFNQNTQERTIWVLISDLWEQWDFSQQKDSIKDIEKSIIEKKQKIIIIWLWSHNWDYVKYPSWERITSGWKFVKSVLNSEYGKYLSKELNSQYKEYDNIEKDISIDIEGSTFNTIESKNIKTLEIIWSFLWLLWI